MKSSLCLLILLCVSTLAGCGETPEEREVRLKHHRKQNEKMANTITQAITGALPFSKPTHIHAACVAFYNYHKRWPTSKEELDIFCSTVLKDLIRVHAWGAEVAFLNLPDGRLKVSWKSKNDKTSKGIVLSGTRTYQVPKYSHIKSVNTNSKQSGVVPSNGSEEQDNQ